MSGTNTYPGQSSTAGAPTYSGYQQTPANAAPPAAAAPGQPPQQTTPVMAQAVMYGTPQAHILVPGGQPILMVSSPYPGGYWPSWPCQTQCPHCGASVTTRVNTVPGTITWLSCAGLALIGCWLGCCLLPFCIDGLQDQEHFCPNCNRLIGVRRQMDC